MMQQDELAIEFEAERVPERRFNREPAQIVGGPPQAPEFVRGRGTGARASGAYGLGIGEQHTIA